MKTTAIVASVLVACAGCAAKGALTQETFVAPGYRIVIPERWGTGRTLPSLPLFPGFQRPDEEFNYRTYAIRGASPAETLHMTLSWTANVVYAGKSDSGEQEFKRFIDDAVSSWQERGWTDIRRAALPARDVCCVGASATGTGPLFGSTYRFIKVAVLRSDGLATAEIGGLLTRLEAENVDSLVGDLTAAMTSGPAAK